MVIYSFTHLFNYPLPRWFFVVCCSLFVVRCSLLVVGCWLLVVGCWFLFSTPCSSLSALPTSQHLNISISQYLASQHLIISYTPYLPFINSTFSGSSRMLERSRSRLIHS